MKHQVAVLVLSATVVPKGTEPIGYGQKECIDPCAICHSECGNGKMAAAFLLARLFRHRWPYVVQGAWHVEHACMARAKFSQAINAPMVPSGGNAPGAHP